MQFHQTQFLTSAAKLNQLPEDTGIEVAFAGRSNAGKSSALNTLTQQRQLARTSKTPGRTQLINLFSVTETCRLVDLPGYGYAKVSQAVKEAWQKTLSRYLQERRCLKGLIIVMDSRHPLKETDQAMLDWAIAAQLPCHLLLTKSDKLTQQQRAKTLKAVKAQVAAYPLASVQLFSSLKRTGLDVLEAQLQKWFALPSN